MMSNKQNNNFFKVDIKFALGYRPFFIMVGVDTGLPEQKKKIISKHINQYIIGSQILWRLKVKKTLHIDFDVLRSY